MDHIALNDAAREARKLATRDAETRFELEARVLRQRCDEHEEHIARLLQSRASDAEQSQHIQRLTVDLEAAAAAAMRSKQAQGKEREKGKGCAAWNVLTEGEGCLLEGCAVVSMYETF